MKFIPTILLALSILLISISCQTNKNKQTTNLPLSNQWVISSFNEGLSNSKPITENSFITINEKENNFSGNAGCNRISGNITVSKNTIKFGKIITTRMSCPDLEQEIQFIKKLETATKFEIIGCELFLYNESKKIATLQNCR